MLANHVTKNNAFLSDMNKIFFLDKENVDEWPKMKKKWLH